MVLVEMQDQGRSRNIISWVVRIVFGIMFLGAAAFKLSGNPAAVQEFNHVGFGQWFRYFTAATEVSGALLLLWPRTIAFGAVLLTAVCVGAFFAQLLKLHGDVIHTIVMTAVLGGIFWGHRGQVSAPQHASTAAMG